MSKKKEMFKRKISGEFEPWLREAYMVGYLQAIARASNPELSISKETIEADFQCFLKIVTERD